MIYGIVGLELGLVIGIFLEALVTSGKTADLEMELAHYKQLGSLEYLRKLIYYSKEAGEMAEKMEDDGK